MNVPTQRESAILELYVVKTYWTTSWTRKEYSTKSPF